jgi:hypothetical protein
MRIIVWCGVGVDNETEKALHTEDLPTLYISSSAVNESEGAYDGLDV